MPAGEPSGLPRRPGTGDELLLQQPDRERALKNEYSNDAHKRGLQLEAKAHIAVQKWIDGGGLRGRAATTDGIREVHRRFCELLPEDFLWGGTRKRRNVYGSSPANCARKTSRSVLIAVSPGGVPRFLMRFEEVYAHLSKTESIVGAAAAHHRLVWIHPFVDGNGRVSRLMSHAMLLETLDTGAVWSVARGLARNVDAYKGHLAACDSTRRNDLDGRENLSEEALAGFTDFFLRTCIDQVEFMESLMQPDRLRARILLWADEEIRLDTLPPKSGSILEAVLYRGELPSADAGDVCGRGGAPCAPYRLGTGRAGGARLGESARAAPPRLPGGTCFALDAGLFPERAETVERRDLKFPEPEEGYVSGRDVVVFWGLDGETRVRCAISREALNDHFGRDGKDKLAVFRGNRPAIEEEARRKYLAGRIEPDGAVLIRTGDL